MKRLVVAGLLELSLVGGAWGQAIDVASYTPQSEEAAMKESGWNLLSESKTTTSWYAYWSGAPTKGIELVLKAGNKSFDKSYTSISTVSGFIDCNGIKSDEFPPVLKNPDISLIDVKTGLSRLGAPSETMPTSDITLDRNTGLANAARRICEAVNRRS